MDVVLSSRCSIYIQKEQRKKLDPLCVRRVREWAELINTLTQPIYTLWNRNNAQNRTKTPLRKEANEGEWEERTKQQQAHSMTKKIKRDSIENCRWNGILSIVIFYSTLYAPWLHVLNKHKCHLWNKSNLPGRCYKPWEQFIFSIRCVCAFLSALNRAGHVQVYWVQWLVSCLNGKTHKCFELTTCSVA